MLGHFICQTSEKKTHTADSFSFQRKAVTYVTGRLVLDGHTSHNYVDLHIVLGRLVSDVRRWRRLSAPSHGAQHHSSCNLSALATQPRWGLMHGGPVGSNKDPSLQFHMI